MLGFTGEMLLMKLRIGMGFLQGPHNQWKLSIEIHAYYGSVVRLCYSSLDELLTGVVYRFRTHLFIVFLSFISGVYSVSLFEL